MRKLADPLSQCINPVSIVTAGDLAEAITDDVINIFNLITGKDEVSKSLYLKSTD